MEAFADSYARGQTPVPCVECNKTVKFTDLLALAHELGAEALLWNRVSRDICYAPAYTIMGGTTNVLRNIIGDRVLGLPREPAVDRGVPFRELKVGTQTS